MGIKGHAVIELRNEATGEVQKVEHDNMVTRGLEYCMTPWFGKFNFASTGSTPQNLVGTNEDNRKKYNRSMMNHLMGGIFLFGNKLEEDVNNVAFPTDNPLTGKASYDMYGGLDTYRGSYNGQESGLQEDGSYKHVWDFATNQANGQISALALTTWKGGICGCGYKDWNYSLEANMSESPIINLGEIRISSTAEAELFPFVKAESNEIYRLGDSYNLTYYTSYNDRHLSISKKLKLKMRKFPLSAISPFWDYYNQYIEREVEIVVPEEFATYAAKTSCFGRISDSFAFIFKRENLNSGNSFKIMRIVKENLSADVITLTNSIPYTISMTESTIFTDKYLLVMGNGPEGQDCRYRINLENGEIALARDAKKFSGTPYRSEIINSFLYETSASNRTYCTNIDTLEGWDHPLAYTTESATTFLSTEKITPNIYVRFLKYNYGSNNQYTSARVGILANTLMTINNLPSPVVKTAAQTMKITYTIQETGN